MAPRAGGASSSERARLQRELDEALDRIAELERRASIFERLLAAVFDYAAAMRFAIEGASRGEWHDAVWELRQRTDAQLRDLRGEP